MTLYSYMYMYSCTRCKGYQLTMDNRSTVRICTVYSLGSQYNVKDREIDISRLSHMTLWSDFCRGKTHQDATAASSPPPRSSHELFLPASVPETAFIFCARSTEVCYCSNQCLVLQRRDSVSRGRRECLRLTSHKDKHHSKNSFSLA